MLRVSVVLFEVRGLVVAHFKLILCMCVYMRFYCVSAYEKALAVASTEKEKAYILTALALLQHRLGNKDAAKTLLFKW